MSAAAKELLLEASETKDKFLELVKKHNDRADPYDLEDVLPALDRKQLDRLWSNLQMEFTATILSFGQDPENHEESCLQIKGIVAVAVETIAIDDPYIPQSLLQTAIILHGVLLSLPAEIDNIKNEISRLFELWWKLDLLCRHEISTHTIIYVMERTERSNGTKADVKRVSQLKEVLNQVNLSSESSNNLRQHLQSASISLLYLRTEEGRRFLSQAFNQSPDVTDMLHRTIKKHMPWAPKSVIPLYGEIYFKAWRNAAGQNLEKLETSCIQDFMYHGILAQSELSSSIRKILSYFHQQKSQRGVDTMLVNLYEPILWRHLKVANGEVRRQAVSILIDVFPLYSPTWGVQERDDMMQKQFDTLHEMLYDPLPAVRATVVCGVCSIHNQYWELIPADVIEDLLHCVVNDLAYDGASADVRVAVFNGLMNLIDNPLTHPVLKMLLPQMSSCFHDVSEKVRIAFVDMLLKVKTVKAVKFWDVVPQNHLLSRLEVDTPPIARRLVKLLVNSYLPPDKGSDVHLTRCLSLVEVNPGAARRFYQYVTLYATLGTAVRLMATIFNTLNSCLEKLRTRQSTTMTPPPAEPDFLESFEEEDRVGPSAEAPTEGEEAEFIAKKDIVAGLLEVTTILWTSLSPQLNTESADEMKDKLERQASRVLPSLFSYYKDPQILTPLFKLSGFVSPTLLPSISLSLLSKLKHMTEEASPDEYTPLLEVMCLWGRVKDIIELVSDWLMFALHGKKPADPKVRRMRSVSFNELIDPQPLLALKYMSHIMQHKVCRETLLADTNNNALTKLADDLSSIKKCVEKHLQSPTSLGDHYTDDFLARTFEIYLKLEILINTKTNADHNSITVVEQILSWTEVELLALLKKKKGTKKSRKLLGRTEMTLISDGTLPSPTSSGMTLGVTTFEVTANETLSDTLLGQKRSVGDGQTGGLKTFAINLIQRLLKVTADMLLVGQGDSVFASHLADFALLLLKIDDNCTLQFLLPVCRLMYQITEVTLTLDPTPEGDSVSSMINMLLREINVLSANKKEQIERMLPTIKPALTEMLCLYYGHHSLSDTLQTNVMATITAAIVTDMTDVIEQDYNYQTKQAVQELPVLTAFLFSILWKRSALVGILLQDLYRYIQLGDDVKLENIAAVCHVLCTVSKCKRNILELKECIQAVELKLDDQTKIIQSEMDDSPIRHLYEHCKVIVDQCKTQIDMQ